MLVSSSKQSSRHECFLVQWFALAPLDIPLFTPIIFVIDQCQGPIACLRTCADLQKGTMSAAKGPRIFVTGGLGFIGKSDRAANWSNVGPISNPAFTARAAERSQAVTPCWRSSNMGTLLPSCKLKGSMRTGLIKPGRVSR